MTPEDVLRHTENPFSTLGLPCALIAAKDLKRQYRKLALQFHPDKNTHPKTEEAFKAIAAAFERLSALSGTQMEALVQQLQPRAGPPPPTRGSRTFPCRGPMVVHCPHCDFTGNAAEVAEHSAGHACPHCSFRGSAAALAAHQRVHQQWGYADNPPPPKRKKGQSESERVTCGDCGRSFPGAALLRRHLAHAPINHAHPAPARPSRDADIF